MSHFTTIQTQIRDLEALNAACAEMGFKFVANANCRGYAGIPRKAPQVIQLKGPYDNAFDPSPENNGTYGLTTDWWDGHAAKEVGIGYGRLLQSYGRKNTMATASWSASMAMKSPASTAEEVDAPCRRVRCGAAQIQARDRRLIFRFRQGPHEASPVARHPQRDRGNTRPPCSIPKGKMLHGGPFPFPIVNQQPPQPPMKTTIKENVLHVKIPLQAPRPSSTGKTLTVASSKGNQIIEFKINGSPVIVDRSALRIG